MTPYGPWEPLERIGQGGMGVVHRARHRDTGAIAALKTVRSPDPSLRAALRREIRALASVRHPGLARILDEGVDGQDAWYAMTWIDAGTLHDAWSASGVQASTTLGADPGGFPPTQARPAASGRPGWEDWVPTLAALCVTLAHVHGAGLVHGDLKPANVLVPERQRPVLVDFGLTSRLGSREDPERVASVTTAWGTPAYRAPERIAGGAFDSRADLYALGCMLYELIVGVPPFVGTPAEIARAHHSMAPMPLDERVDGVPPELVRLVHGLLVKDPGGRPAHASDVAVALGASPPDAPPVIFRPRLVGRQPLRQALAHALDAAMEGRGGAVVLRGEPGVGKTRLALDLLETARARGALVVSGQCAPLDGPSVEPLSSVAQAVRAAVSIARHEGPAGTSRLFGDQARLLARWVPEVADVPGFDAQPPLPEVPVALGGLVVDALTALVAHLASGPTVWFVDDIQWADALGSALLQRLGERARGLPLLVLATARPEARAPAGFDTLDVGPLDAPDAAALIADMLGNAVPHGFVDAATRAAEGSPFLLTELVRAALVDRTVDPSVALPDARSLAARRVAARTEGQQDVLVGVWVLGHSASPERLAALVGHPEEQVLDATHALSRAELIVPTPTGGSAFAHAHIRDAVHDALGDTRARGLHRHAARLLRDDPRVGRAEVADHLHRAGDPDDARPLYREAAREALQRYALDDAERWLARASDVQRPDPEGARAAVELAQEVQGALGRPADARQTLLAHVPHVDALGDPALEASLHTALAASQRQLGELDHARRSAERAVACAPDVELRARALGELARVLTVTGDLEGAVRTCREARVDPPASSALRAVLKVEALALWHLSRNDEAVALGEELLALSTRDGTRYERAEALYTLATIQVEAGLPDASERAHRDAMAEFEALGARRMVALCLGNLAGFEMRAGRLDDALATLIRSADVLAQTGDQRAAALTRLNAAHVQELQHDLVGACRTYAEAAAVLERIGEAQLSRALVGWARALRLTGAPVPELLALTDRADAAATSPSARVLVRAEQVQVAVVAGRDPGPLLHDLERLAATVDLFEYLQGPVEQAREAARVARITGR